MAKKILNVVLKTITWIIVIAVVAFAYGVNSIFSKEPGWYEIEADSAGDTNCGSEFVFMYYLGASGNATAENKELSVFYTDACEMAHKLFNNKETFEGITNVCYINQHPNEVLEVEPALYGAFEIIARYANRNIYLAPVYSQYDEIFLCNDDSQLVNFDPRLNEEVAADYAKIAGKYTTGDYSFAIDMSYFRSHQELLTYIPDPLDKMYKDYQNTNQKWQLVPDINCLCLKFRSEDWETIAPPYIAMFESLINLSDLESIQAVADAQEIYKLIWYEMETIGDDVDDFKVDPSLSIEYFNRLINEALPDYISAAMVPGKLDTISFTDTQKVNDTSKIATATETVLNTSGASEILNGKTISGAEAFRYAQIANTEYAISSLLPQTQAWLNRFLSLQLSNPSKVEFFPVSVYTKDALKKDLLESCQYGFNNKLAYNTLNGISERETLAMAFFEEEVLKLHDIMKYPLSSSFTTSGKNNQTGEEGKPKDDIQTTSGEESEEKRDKSEG